MKYFITTLLLAITHFASAQSLKESISHFRNYLMEQPGFHIRMSVQVYESENGLNGSPEFTQQIKVTTDNKHYYYHTGVQEMLMTPEMLIMTEPQQRQLYVQQNSSSDYSAPIEQLFDLDSLLGYYGEPQTLSASGSDELRYRITQSSGEITTIDMGFSRADNLLKDIQYTYLDGRVAIIRFEVVRPINAIDRQRLSAGYFLRRNDEGTYTGTGSYAGYNVNFINQ